MALIAFNELDHALNKAELISYPLSQPSESALFVTWKIKGDLRGCIGTFIPQPTIDLVRKYALIAALQDPRFDPISPQEFKQLDCTVTFLGPLEPIEKDDWIIGKDGLKATFPGNKSATFLPEVALEQNWTKHETYEMLARKAGAMGLSGMKLMKYKGTKDRMDYNEYIKTKQN